MDKGEAMKAIRDEILTLEDSPLYAYRVSNNYFPVIGEGDHDAEIIFIGEAPGENEAKCGRPFCGRAGKILDEFLASIDLPRENVYITNIVKDRPPGNRDPFPDEIEKYAPFLDRQIDIIKPKVIATLGRFSMKYVMERYGLKDQVLPISQAHGKIFETKTGFGEVYVIPLYHPAVAIYNSNTKGELKDDFRILKKFIQIK